MKQKKKESSEAFAAKLDELEFKHGVEAADPKMLKDITEKRIKRLCNDGVDMRLKRYIQRYKQKHDSNDCGPICIRMVLNSFLPPCKKIFGSDLPKGRKTKDEIKAIINEKGFCFRELKSKSEDKSINFIREAIRRNNPVIVSCRSTFEGERDSHYIVIKGIDAEYIYVNDPYPGKPDLIKRDSFMKRRGGRKSTNWGASRWALEVYLMN